MPGAADPEPADEIIEVEYTDLGARWTCPACQGTLTLMAAVGCTCHFCGPSQGFPGSGPALVATPGPTFGAGLTCSLVGAVAAIGVLIAALATLE